MIRKYKLRAECAHDVREFINDATDSLVNYTLERVHPMFPDVEFTFETAMPFVEIQEILHNIIDGHVMVETVSLFELYTGER